MLKYTCTFGKKKVIYEPYTCKQEKDIMISCAGGEDDDIDRALDICNVNYKGLNRDQKVALLYKLRAVSVSDKMSINFTCPHCGQVTETIIDVDSIMQSPTKHSKWIVDPLKDINDEDIDKCFVEGYEDLDYDVYENLRNNIADYITTYNFNPLCECIRCHEKTMVSIGKPKFVLDNMSDSSIAALYSMYASLTYNGHFSLADINSMYPFERSIYVAQINKIIEKQNKQGKR